MSFPPATASVPTAFYPQEPASCPAPHGSCSSSATRRYLGVPTTQLWSAQPGLGIHPEADNELGSRGPPQSHAEELGSKQCLFQSTGTNAEGMTQWQSLDQSAQAKAGGVAQWQSLDQSEQAKVEGVTQRDLGPIRTSKRLRAWQSSKTHQAV